MTTTGEASANGPELADEITSTSLTAKADSASQPSTPLSYKATIICIILVAVGLRPGIVSIGPLLSTIRDQFGLSHAQASLLTSIPDVLMGALALPSPWLARRFGRDRVIMAALVLLFLSLAARSITGTTSTLLLTTAGVGAGIAISGALIAGFVKASYPAKAALLIGIYATSLSLGSMISAAATGPVTALTSSWRIGAGMWVIPIILGVAAWIYVERKSPAGQSAKSAATYYPLPLKSLTAWLIALFFACDNLLFYAYLTWIAPMYTEHGFGAATSGYILAAYTGAFLVGSLLFSAISRNEDRRVLLALTAAVSLAGIIPVAISPDAAPFLFIPILAFGMGGAFSLGMTLPLDNARTADEANVWNAFTLTVGYLIAATGPLVVGALRDVTGDFEAGLWVLAGVGVVMLAITPLLQPHHQRLDSK